LSTTNDIITKLKYIFRLVGNYKSLNLESKIHVFVFAQQITVILMLYTDICKFCYWCHQLLVSLRNWICFNMWPYCLAFDLSTYKFGHGSPVLCPLMGQGIFTGIRWNLCSPWIMVVCCRYWLLW